MTCPGVKRTVLVGVGLTTAYTLLISSADAITKLFAAQYAAPQLFALSGGLVAFFSILANRNPNGTWRGLRTVCPRAMAVRAVATVAGTLAFFYAFRFLPFAEVFLFIALIPLIAALLSGPVLGEPVQKQVWCALAFGVLGMACLFPTGFDSIGPGHFVAFCAVCLGTVSMVASRYIGQRDDNLLAQVFYPNLALMAVMLCALPFVFAPMSLRDVGLATTYAGLLFLARWLLVTALSLMPAYVVTPLMNLQFIWMVIIGFFVFSEKPGAGVYIGAFVIIAAGGWLVWDQSRPSPKNMVMPAQ